VDRLLCRSTSGKFFNDHTFVKEYAMKSFTDKCLALGLGVATVLVCLTPVKPCPISPEDTGSLKSPPIPGEIVGSLKPAGDMECSLKPAGDFECSLKATGVSVCSLRPPSTSLEDAAILKPTPTDPKMAASFKPYGSKR